MQFLCAINATYWVPAREPCTHTCIARHTHTPFRLADCADILSCIFISLLFVWVCASMCVCEAAAQPHTEPRPTPNLSWVDAMCPKAIMPKRCLAEGGSKGSPSLSVIQSVGHYGSKSNFKVLSALTAHPENMHWRWHEQYGERGRERRRGAATRATLQLHLSGNSLRISEICVCALKFELLMRIVVNFEGERGRG